MSTVLSGLQPSGQLHLGNWAGAIRQFLDLQHEHDLYVFVASYHALTTTRGEELRDATRQVVIDYLAFGLDPDRCNIYLQQDLPQVTELAWILSCVCPKHLMDKAVSFKDKVGKGLSASVGLYTYPILQAADILIVDADVVPVGKDQVQHIEITRDLAVNSTITPRVKALNCQTTVCRQRPKCCRGWMVKKCPRVTAIPSTPSWRRNRCVSGS